MWLTGGGLPVPGMGLIRRGAAIPPINTVPSRQRVAICRSQDTAMELEITSVSAHGCGCRRPLGLWRPVLCSMFAALVWVLSGCTLATDQSAETEAIPAFVFTSTDTRVAYTPRLEGQLDTRLRGLLEDSARLFRFMETPPASLLQLRRRAEGDVGRLLTVLRSEGYYKSSVNYRIEESESSPVVVLEIEPGPLFTLAHFRVTHPDPSQGHMAETLLDSEKFGLLPGMPARSEPIVEAERAVLRQLANNGRPFAEVLDREFVADHAQETVTVDLVVDPGPEARFGPLITEGLVDVDLRLVELLVPWREGDVFSRRAIEDFERRLLSTGLFRSAVVWPEAAPSEDGTLPLTVALRETAHRSLGGGILYSSHEGPGVTGFWEHRNLLSMGERLRISTRVAELEQQVGATVTKPVFLRPDQTLLGDVVLQRERRDGFDRDGLQASIGLERVLNRHVTVQGRISTEFSSILDSFEKRDLALLGLPVGLRYDTTDALLDPTKGLRASINATPVVGSDQESSLAFGRMRLSTSAYHAVGGDERFVAAARGRVGSIIGASRERIPAHYRFYSGGGGSVRGFAPRLIGPLDAGNKPEGGLSMIEAGLEMRIRVSDSLGIVPFVEAGTVSKGIRPNLGGAYGWAAGLGGRYYTAFGPIRLDLAVPLNPRRGIDDPFQFYVSIGQAF